jgi:5-methyltetrahydropteroyltriglutamate--homocysteine methyltransferase
MNVTVTTTGSYPPLRDRHDEILVEESIRRAIENQVEMGVDVLVDGQPRSDIVGIFASEIGLDGRTLPYFAANKLGKPKYSTALADLELASKYAQGRPLKAHLTGPVVIAESCLEERAHADYLGREGLRRLVLDIADALAEEALLIAGKAQALNIQYLQIDEPSLVYGANRSLAREGIERVVSTWRQNGGGLVLLHVCGDSAAIWEDLLDMPVDILNLESDTLRTLSEEHAKKLAASGKRLALGTVPVNTDHVPSPQRVAREALFAAARFGEEAIWGLTPDCGLRLSPLEKALQRMRRLHEAAQILKRETRDQEDS